LPRQFRIQNGGIQLPKHTYSAIQGALGIKADTCARQMQQDLWETHTHRPAAVWERNPEDPKMVPGACTEVFEPGSKWKLVGN